jgi:hypothetical protein
MKVGYHNYYSLELSSDKRLDRVKAAFDSDSASRVGSCVYHKTIILNLIHLNEKF